jgi:outer membrane lipoprotein
MQGSQVRWGGTILRVETKQHETCFQVLAFALRDDGAPDVSDAPEGRFVACAEGFYEPAVYRPERRITVVGVIGAPTSIKVGDYETQVPTVTVGRIKLWPRRPPVMTFYGEPWPGAWAAPWYPFVW